MSNPETSGWSPEDVRKEIEIYQDLLDAANDNWSAVTNDIMEGGEPTEEHMKQLAQTESAISMRIKELREVLAGKTAEMFDTWVELGNQQQRIAKQLEAAEGDDAKNLVDSYKKVLKEREDIAGQLKNEFEASLGQVG